MAHGSLAQFQAFTGDIERLAEWLVSLGIRTGAMESTGVYRVPVYEILEDRGLEVILANARDCKSVPGRKSVQPLRGFRSAGHPHRGP